MSAAEEILNTPKIRQFLETHVDASDAVKRAAEVLEARPDAATALEKVLHALSANAISVFFSYKKKDELTAMAVVKTLRDYSAGKLDITYQAEFTQKIAGQEWRQAIRKAVWPANWFVLLLPDPSDDWDWCLFETGLFEAHRCSADRLICLHHPETEIPSQIEDYQAVPATVEEVEKLLRMIFVLDDPVPGMKALNPSLENRLPELAQQIVEAVRAPRKALVRETFEPRVELKIEHPETLDSQDALDGARISSANRAALDIFGFLKAPKTWAELRSGVLEADEDSRWRFELAHVLRHIAEGRKFHPVQAVFKASDGRIYWPVACSVDRVGEDGPIETFHVMFTEDVTAVDRSSMPKDVSVLADLLRFVFRFRWEVLEAFSRSPTGEEDLSRLSHVLERIKKDWESRHVGSQEEIMSLFSDEHRERFEEMATRWAQITNDEGSGKLDLAIENGKTEGVAEMLADFLPLNQEFLQIAATRFSELIAGDKKPD